jgi:signal transduction histidine kinase
VKVQNWHHFSSPVWFPVIHYSNTDDSWMLADGVVEKPSQLQHYGSIITFQTRQLIDLVDQILTFSSATSKEEHYELRSLEVAQLVDLALLNTQATMLTGGFEIEVDLAPGLPPVRGDQAAIVSCLQNLLTNAVKYSGRSRWIRIAAQLAKERSTSVVLLSVEDRGIGIAAEELADVFKPFYRSSAAKVAQIHGTGLGLSVAKEITEAMGGRITVKSSLGAGTTFTLALPVSSEALDFNG